MMDCTDDNMTEASLAISMMTAGEKKNTAVKEMTMAREMLGKDDMAGCKTHLNNAIKIEKSK